MPRKGTPECSRLKVARQLSPSGKISIRSPTGHGPMTRTASARTIASSSRVVFLTFCMAAVCRAPVFCREGSDVHSRAKDSGLTTGGPVRRGSEADPFEP
jgi:hypothetical protein